MSDCPEKFPLSWLNEKVDHDDRFAAEALAIRLRIESYQPSHQRQTHTAASSATGLVNHWLVQRDLKGYARGRLVDDFTDLSVTPFDGCYSKGIASLESSIFIMRDELTALMRSECMTIPDYLAGTSDKATAEDALSTAPDAPADPVMVPPSPKKMKKAALILKYKSQWPTIESALNDASRNELAQARIGVAYYDEAAVVRWAQERGKLKEAIAPTSLKMADVPGRVIKRGD